MGAGSKARGWIVYMGWETFNRLQTWLVSPRETSLPELGVIGSSFMFTIFLMIMKIRFLWWPLHPGGYVLVSGTPGWVACGFRFSSVGWQRQLC